MKLLKFTFIALLCLLPAMVFARSSQFVSAPLTPVPNQTGLNSATPFQFFSQGEYVNLVDGHLTLEPKGFSTQVYGVKLTINPAYNPNREIFGKEEYVFSQFESDEYPALDGNDADRVEVIPIEADLGIFGQFSAKVEGDTSRFRIGLNQDRWQMAINGIVGAIAVWFEPPEYENTGEDGMLNPSNLPSYFIIKADGSVVFVSAVEQGFRKEYGVYGGQDVKNAETRFSDVVIQDSSGVGYHFSRDQGYLSAGNQRYVETEIKAIDCYWVWFWEECSDYLHFPGWKVQTLFLNKIEDAFGNAVDISLTESGDYLVKTAKGNVDIVREGNNVRVVSRFGGGSRSWLYTFDDDGNLLAADDPGGLRTTYNYSLASGFPRHRQAGPVFTGEPDNTLEVHYPTGGVLRYEAFYSHFFKGVIVTEFPDPANTNDFFQKYVLAGVGQGGGTTTVFETDGTKHFYNYTQKAGVLVLSSRETKFLGETIKSIYDWDVRVVNVPTSFAPEEFEMINGPSLVASHSNGVSFETHFFYDEFGRLARRLDPLGTEYRYGYQCNNLYNTDLASIETSKVGLDINGNEHTDDLRLTVTPFFPVNCEPGERIKFDYSFWRPMVQRPEKLCQGSTSLEPGVAMDEEQKRKLEQMCVLLKQIQDKSKSGVGLTDIDTLKALFSKFRSVATGFPGLNFPFLVDEVKISAGGNDHTLMKNFFHPSTGNILRSEDSQGNGTLFLYGGSRLMTEVNYNGSMAIDLNSRQGLLERLKNGELNVGDLTFIASNQITGKNYKWDNDKDTPSEISDTGLNSISFTRDSSGNLTEINFKSLMPGSSTNSSVTNRYEFSNFGARIETTIHNPERSPDITQTRIQDGLGFVREEKLGDGASTRFAYARNKLVGRITLPDGRVSQFVYDGAQRLKDKITPEGDHLRYTYGRETLNQFGRQIPTEKITIGRQNKTVIVAYRDPLGRVVRIDRPSGSGTETDRYRYDDFGNLIAHQAPDGKTDTNSFDAISRLSGRKFSDGSKWQVNQFDSVRAIDPTSILLEGIAASGGTAPARAFDIAYDTRDRPTEIKFAGSAAPFLKLTYDEFQFNDSHLGNVIQNGLGNLTTVDDETGRTKFFYGGFDKITAVARTINATPVQVPYVVAIMDDGFGNPSRVKYPRPARLVGSGLPPGVSVFDGPEIFYTTDAKGRLSEVRKDSKGGPVIASFEYDNTDQLTKLTYGNGVTTEYTYGLSGRISSVRVKNGDKKISSEEYAYDFFGNKTWERHLDGSIVAYNYDSLNRPTTIYSYKSGEQAPFFTQTYTYDAAGNLAQYSDNRRTITYHYNSNNQLTSYDTGAYSQVALSYDGFGNVAQERHLLKDHEILVKNFTYDNLGRLKQIATTNRRTGFTSTASYTYDAWGRRQMKDAAGKKKFYVYGQSSSPMAELDAYGLPENYHVYAGGRRIAILEKQGIKYVHTDVNGSAKLVTNSAGRVIQRKNFDLRGNETFEFGSDKNPYGFGGFEKDAETGLIFTGASYFNPLTGQVVSHNTNILGAKGKAGFTEATSSVLSYLSDTETKLPADPGGFYATGARMVRTTSLFDTAGVDDFGGAGSLCIQVSSWPGIYGACVSSITNLGQLENLGSMMNMDAIEKDIKRGFKDKILDYAGYNLPIWGDLIKSVLSAIEKGDNIAEKILLIPIFFTARLIDFFTQPLQVAFEWIGQHFFGFGPDYRELDHTPSEWDHTNIASPKNNVEQADTRLIKALEPTFSFGRDSAAVLSELSIYGIVPPFGDALGPRGNFGLSRSVALPSQPFSLQGNPAPMVYGERIYDAIP